MSEADIGIGTSGEYNVDIADRIQFDEGMKAFFETISADAPTLEQREACVRKGLAVLVGRLRLGRVEITLDVPRNRLIPDGKHMHSVLYESDKGEYGEVFKAEFPISSGGCITFIDNPLGENYTDEEIKIHEFIFREIFFQYNRTMSRAMLDKVIYTDTNTGIPNLDAFMTYTGRLVGRCQISSYKAVFFNIHNFKYVNKVFAYAQGDIVLRNYAQLVQSYLDQDEMIARLGGDNFVVLCRKSNTKDFLDRVSDLHITHEHGLIRREFQLGVTAGYASLDGIASPREIMARISLAYQMARRRGPGAIVEYSPELKKVILDDQEILFAFPNALANEEFVVYYQPKVDITDMSICGAEALIRWLRDGVIMPPVRFIPLLEREGSVCQLDYYVLENVCKLLKERKDKGRRLVPISVNFSRRHLEEEDMVRNIVELTDRYGIDRKYIDIELTESEDYQNYEIMSSVMNKLKNQGFATSIDDFGTGFSSLNMIKKVDLDTVKIDKSLMPMDGGKDSSTQDIVMFRNIVTLINELGKKSVAEGVETDAQLVYLREYGCNIVQGYIFDKPLTREDFERRLESGYDR